MNAAREDGGDRSGTVNVATEIRQRVNLGRTEESNLQEKNKVDSGGEKSGNSFEIPNKKIMLLPPFVENKSICEGNNITEDSAEIIISDPKRRRVGHEDNGLDTEMSTSPKK